MMRIRKFGNATIWQQSLGPEFYLLSVPVFRRPYQNVGASVTHSFHADVRTRNGLMPGSFELSVPDFISDSWNRIQVVVPARNRGVHRPIFRRTFSDQWPMRRTSDSERFFLLFMCRSGPLVFIQKSSEG